MTTSLRTLFDYAENQVSTFKNPNTDEFKIRMSEVLEAAGMNNLNYDSIESISEYLGNITIETSWSARGCAQSSEYTLPSYIIDAEDPIHEAKKWGLAKKLKAAQIEYKKHAALANSYAEKAAQLQEELNQLTKGE